MDTTFPKGQVLDRWLGSVGALSGGALHLTGVANSVSATVPPTSRWIYDSSNSEPKLLSFQTPVGGVSKSSPSYCGRAVFTDWHAGSAPSGDVPSACAQAELSAEEKALEFLLFDMPACVSDFNPPPKVPPPPAP